ncbi:hypothetical protein [Sphingomonas sp.]|uniref:hypothetical protein n=1 Tax=Sphingomonas sp. TaxID=28214 RepID=UPI0025DC94E7|nr:hypothetical protein [Sphingomonas sp.]
MGEIVEGKTRLKKRRASPQTITPEQIETFFATLADTCNVVRSAKAAGFAANWAYRRRKFDAAFRNGWVAAVREGYAKLELVLLERAIKGTPKLVRTAKGTDRVMREYSTALAVALLRRHAETADNAAFEPSGDELREIRERILEKLRRLKQRDEASQDKVETKASNDSIDLIRWALCRSV